jgi:hypothetical protein
MTGGRRLQVLTASTGAWLARLFVLAVVCVLSGCLGGQTGQNDAVKGQCNTGPIAIARDENSELGITPEQGVARFAQQRELVLVWSANEGTVPARMSLRYDGVDASKVYVDCRVNLELAVVLSFTSDDGRLDEQLPATLTIESAEQARLTGRIALATLAGNYDGSADAAGDLRDPVVVLDANFDGDDSTGTLTLVEAAENGGGQRMIIVARWSAAR